MGKKLETIIRNYSIRPSICRREILIARTTSSRGWVLWLQVRCDCSVAVKQFRHQWAPMTSFSIIVKELKRAIIDLPVAALFNNAFSLRLFDTNGSSEIGRGKPWSPSSAGKSETEAVAEFDRDAAVPVHFWFFSSSRPRVIVNRATPKMQPYNLHLETALLENFNQK